MSRRLGVLALVLVTATAAHAGKKKKAPAEPPPPLVGWNAVEGGTGSCYHPPDFTKLGVAERRMARDEARTAMMSQWSGQRDDGVQLDPNVIENVETVLLGTPEKTETAAVENLAQCQAAMKGGGTQAWGQWLTALPGKLLVGVCRRPLDNTMFWYLDVDLPWQFEASICDNDVVEITATERDVYKISDKGAWINADGDQTGGVATGSEWPCNQEGCYPGQLVMRFRGESGAVIYKPIGLRLVFDPPEHGVIDIAVNDFRYDDNEYRVERGVQSRTAITYQPMD